MLFDGGVGAGLLDAGERELAALGVPRLSELGSPGFAGRRAGGDLRGLAVTWNVGLYSGIGELGAEG
ncbi:MAG: hypothetical protein ACRDPY_47815, partial [Streptosporangiaceae bacterium]